MSEPRTIKVVHNGKAGVLIVGQDATVICRAPGLAWMFVTELRRHGLAVEYTDAAGSTATFAPLEEGL